MNCITAGRWQKRVDQLLAEGYGDCDKIGLKVLEEMKASGLILGKDMVVCRGTCEGQSHFCIEMWGKNSPDRKGRPVYKINGYRIGTARNCKMKNIWKGTYEVS